MAQEQFFTTETTQAHEEGQICLTQATRSVLQTTLSQVHMLNLMGVVVPFSILDIKSFLSSSHAPGKLCEISPKFQQIHQFLTI